MVGIKKTKRKMDALIRAIGSEDAKDKVYLGYQFPIRNLKLVKKKRGELHFTSSVRDNILNLIVRAEDYKLSKIEDIILSLAVSPSPEKTIKTTELKEKKNHLRKDLEERTQKRKKNRLIAIIIIIVILAATSYWWVMLLMYIIIPHY